jgi:hypothetical protein
MEASSESVAGKGVADRKREQAEPDDQHDDVKHWELPAAAARAERGKRLLRTGVLRWIKYAKGACPTFTSMTGPCLFRYCRDEVPLAAYFFEMKSSATL